MPHFQPQASMPSRPPLQSMPLPMIMFLCGLTFAVGNIMLSLAEVGPVLARTIDQHTTLARDKGLDASAWVAVLISCAQDAKCGPWLSVHLNQGLGWWQLNFLIPFVLSFLAWKLFPKRHTVKMKNPGSAQWETAERMSKFMAGNDSPEDPFVGFLGYLKAGKAAGTSEFDTAKFPPLFIPLSDWCQNTLVWGGIGSGKTTAFFQPNLFLAAHLGITCIVFDVKWPQKGSGFYEAIGYWKACKRGVLLLAPFETTGARVNLLAGVNDFSSALAAADAVFPPPEFADERGKHYNDKKRFMIAALMWIARTQLGHRASVRDVLDLTLWTDDRLMAWVDQSSDETAKAILRNFRAAGDANFAETKNGIISALKVFFNDRVAFATSGTPEETVDLKQYVRTPCLNFIAINQAQQIDGSGEVLFRLYKRLFDLALLEVAQEQGGRLRTHAAYFLDELPAIGKINYLMRSLGTLRSYNISHHIGIQNNAQGNLVFGPTYWEAISTNVISRVVMFPRGINGNDAKVISDTVGYTTGMNVSVGGSQSLNPFDPRPSHSVNASLSATHLLPYEEFSTFGLGEAVVRMNGQHPIRTQLAPMNHARVKGPGIRTGLFRRGPKNVLHQLYAETVANCPGGLVAYTTKLIQSGTFTREIIPAATPPQPEVELADTQVSASPAHSSPVGPPLQPVNVPRPAKPVITPAAPAPKAEMPALLTQTHSVNQDVSAVYPWLQACMNEFVEVECDGDKVRVAINKTDPAAVNSEASVQGFFIGGLLEKNRTQVYAVLTSRAVQSLSEEVRRSIRDYQESRKVHLWFKLNAVFIEGTPKRAQHLLAAGNDSDLLLAPIEAFFENGTLYIRRKLTREAFSGTHSGLVFPSKRVGTVDYDEIPMESFAVTAEAIRQARAAGIAQSSNAPKAVKRTRKQARETALIAPLNLNSSQEALQPPEK